MLHPLFNGQPTLVKLDAALRSLQGLCDIVKNALPKTLRGYCHSVFWSGQMLVINISQNTALCKIRQFCPHLLQTLHQQGIAVSQIKPMMFFAHNPPPPPRKAQKMTAAALIAFQQLQQRISDPALQRAITTLLDAHRDRR